MASSEPASGKVLAREIAAYTDAELDEYLEKHSLEDGTVIVQVHDPENLPESFIYRLRYLLKALPPKHSSLFCSDH